MSEKTGEFGLCDLCGAILADPYTSKGAPRRYCSVDCRNTGNSREGNEERTRKLRESVARGEWVNPNAIRPPTFAEQSARARKGRLREVEEGRWRNPGLTPEARAKNSQPHKHSGVLAEAIEKLRHGKMADLTPEQAEAYRAYKRQLAAQRRNQSNPDNPPAERS